MRTICSQKCNDDVILQTDMCIKSKFVYNYISQKYGLIIDTNYPDDRILLWVATNNLCTTGYCSGSPLTIYIRQDTVLGRFLF